MKKKMIAIIILFALLSVDSETAFAGSWIEPQYQEYHYINDDGSMAVRSWIEDNGKQYFLDDNGKMLMNSLTPDGYCVLSDGSWDGNGRYISEISDLQFEAYKNVLDGYWQNESTGEGRYTLYDLNHDGTNELFIETGSYLADRLILVYSFDGINAYYVGNFGSSFGGLAIGNGSTLYQDCEHMGDRWLNRITWNGGGSINSDDIVASITEKSDGSNDEEYINAFSEYSLIYLYYSKKNDYRLLSLSL